jgi:hypothetical protein
MDGGPYQTIIIKRPPVTKKNKDEWDIDPKLIKTNAKGAKIKAELKEAKRFWRGRIWRSNKYIDP